MTSPRPQGIRPGWSAKRSDSTTSRRAAGRFEWSVSRRTESGFERADLGDSRPAPRGRGGDDDLRGRWSRDNDNARAGITLEVYRRTISAGRQPGDGTAGSLLDAGLSGGPPERPVAGPLFPPEHRSLHARVHPGVGDRARRPILRVDLGGEASPDLGSAPRVGDCPEPSLPPWRASRVRATTGVSTAAASDASAALSSRGRAGRIGPDPREFHPHRRPAAGLFRRRPAARRLQASICSLTGTAIEKLSGSAGGRLSGSFDAAVSAEARTNLEGTSTATRERASAPRVQRRPLLHRGSASLTLRTDAGPIVTCARRRIRQVPSGGTHPGRELLRHDAGSQLGGGT